MAWRWMMFRVMQLLKWRSPTASEIWTITISYVIIGIMCMEDNKDTPKQPEKGPTIIDRINHTIDGMAGWLDTKWGGPTRHKRTGWGRARYLPTKRKPKGRIRILMAMGAIEMISMAIT